ncbi:hypothetical protein F0L74_20520 [Chitinophaga agrisoli]|uniref:Uncharacterized protein n=1 Tax=Chitinophaga agrisoli TaxID=2607653 RepID=A0A5B2VHK4_9BACT|nr:hypothetical protein [Chitinophaga agrisoli]KAA2238611.1 hypothetical protein F0L74_20520 [Chitinophaga agrisoli]
MTVKKSTNQKRAIKSVKRKVAATPVNKKAPKKEFNDDKNNTLEGYDENEFDNKDKADAQRKRGRNVTGG